MFVPVEDLARKRRRVARHYVPQGKMQGHHAVATCLTSQPAFIIATSRIGLPMPCKTVTSRGECIDVEVIMHINLNGISFLTTGSARHFNIILLRGNRMNSHR